MLLVLLPLVVKKVTPFSPRKLVRKLVRTLHFAPFSYSQARKNTKANLKHVVGITRKLVKKVPANNATSAMILAVVYDYYLFHFNVYMLLDYSFQS
jgi:hypothetical protein